MKNKLTKKTKKIFIAEAIFVLGVFVYLFFSTAPSQIYPLHGMTIIEPDFLFEIENGEEVLISTDNEFTNPIILTEDSEITLPPGVYYWKVKSRFRESEIKNFTIQGHVALDIKERGENYRLENEGNVDLNVEKENNQSIENITIEIRSSEEVEKDNSSYKGSQI